MSKTGLGQEPMTSWVSFFFFREVATRVHTASCQWINTGLHIFRVFLFVVQFDGFVQASLHIPKSVWNKDYRQLKGRLGRRLRRVNLSVKSNFSK